MMVSNNPSDSISKIDFGSDGFNETSPEKSNHEQIDEKKHDNHCRFFLRDCRDSLVLRLERNLRLHSYTNGLRLRES